MSMLNMPDILAVDMATPSHPYQPAISMADEPLDEARVSVFRGGFYNPRIHGPEPPNKRVQDGKLVS